LQMTAVRIEPQPESYESTPTTRHLHLHRQVGVNNLPKAVT